MSIEPLAVAIAAAKKTGRILMSTKDEVELMELKEGGSPVTRQDLHAEAVIIELLRQHFPDHAYLGEESGHDPKNTPFRWHIDPLDGTKNYLHGYPFFAVSLALEEAGELLLAVVYNPVSDELFFAERNQGAYLNGRRIAVSSTMRLQDALVATNFHGDNQANPDSNIHHWMHLLGKAQGVRTDGSAALDLCYVAAGRLDGFWSLTVKPWDLAAGVLVVKEAGGVVSDRWGESFVLSTGSIVAANNVIHAELVQMLSIVRVI